MTLEQNCFPQFEWGLRVAVSREVSRSKENASRRSVIPSNRSLFSLGLRLTPDSLKFESPQESQRCRPMRFGILDPFQATFEQSPKARNRRGGREGDASNRRPSRGKIYGDNKLHSPVQGNRIIKKKNVGKEE